MRIRQYTAFAVEVLVPNRSKRIANDGTIDYEYTWGRPVTTYLSTLEYMRLLLLKARLRDKVVELEFPRAGL